jgi:hypothetical protein
MIRSTLVLFLLPLAASAQLFTPSVLTPLSSTLNETSGLVQVNGQVWTHNDSGGPARLYQIDPVNGSVLRALDVANASNVDWEDITADDQWLYIGDVGNNNGDRTNLRVLRVALDSLLDPLATSVNASTIAFAYDQQTDFTAAPNNTDWDCEALVAFNDSLWLFSKNWVSGTSHISVLPAIPGSHTAVRVDTLESQGMITGASFDPTTGDVALIGYTNGLYLPFAWHLQDVVGANGFGDGLRADLPLLFTQFEAIAWHTPGTVLLTNEQSPLSTARLWSMTLEVTTGQESLLRTAHLHVVPLPSAGLLEVYALEAGAALLLDLQGRLLRTYALKPGANTLPVGQLAAGTHLLRTSAGAQRFVWMP